MSKIMIRIVVVGTLASFIVTCYLASRRIGDARELKMGSDVYRLLPPEPVVAVTRDWMPNSLLELLLPISINISNNPAGTPQNTVIIINDFLYSGAGSDPRHARLIALATSKDSTLPPINHLLTKEDRGRGLTEIADRIYAAVPQAPQPLFICVLSVELEWTPWQLRFSVKEGVPNSSSKGKVPSYVLAALNNTVSPLTILQLRTDRVRLPLYGQDSVDLRASIHFEANSVSFGFIPADLNPPMPVPEGDYQLDLTGVPDDTSTALSVPYSFINYLSNTVYGQKSLLVSKTHDGKEIRISKFFATAYTGGFQMEALLDPSPLVPPTAPKDQVVPFKITYRGLSNPVPVDNCKNKSYDTSLPNDLVFDRADLGEVKCGSLDLSQCGAFLLALGALNTNLNDSNCKASLRPLDIFPLGQLLLNGRTLTATALISKAQANSKSLLLAGHINLKNQ